MLPSPTFFSCALYMKMGISIIIVSAMKMTMSLAYAILPNELIGKGYEVLLHDLNGLGYLIQIFKGIIDLSKKVCFPTRT